MKKAKARLTTIKAGAPEVMTCDQLLEMDFPESRRFAELRSQGMPPDKAKEQVNSEFGHDYKKEVETGRDKPRTQED
ncbi:MAG: hypothetical protein ACLQPD_31200 [Desulfomonilaceae bacterium]